MNGKQEITTSKIILLVIGSVISSAIVTAFTLVRVANSDHFTLVAIGAKVEAIEELALPRSEYEQRAVFIDARLDRIETKIDRLLER